VRERRMDSVVIAAGGTEAVGGMGHDYATRLGRRRSLPPCAPMRCAPPQIPL